MQSILFFILLCTGLVSSRALDVSGLRNVALSGLQKRCEEDGITITRGEIKPEGEGQRAVGHSWTGTCNPGKELSKDALISAATIAHQKAQAQAGEQHDKNSMQMAAMQLHDHTVVFASNPHPVGTHSQEMGDVLGASSHPAHREHLNDRNKARPGRPAHGDKLTKGGEYHAEDHVYQQIHQLDKEKKGDKYFNDKGELQGPNQGVVVGHAKADDRENPHVMDNCGAPKHPSMVGKDHGCFNVGKKMKANWINGMEGHQVAAGQKHTTSHSSSPEPASKSQKKKDESKPAEHTDESARSRTGSPEPKGKGKSKAKEPEAGQCNQKRTVNGHTACTYRPKSATEHGAGPAKHGASTTSHNAPVAKHVSSAKHASTAEHVVHAEHDSASKHAASSGHVAPAKHVIPVKHADSPKHEEPPKHAAPGKMQTTLKKPHRH